MKIKSNKWVKRRGVYELEIRERTTFASALAPKVNTAKLKAELDALTDEERLELFNKYCDGCGGKDVRCHCQNDE